MKLSWFTLMFAMFSVTATADEYLMPKNLNYKNLYFDNEQTLQGEQPTRPLQNVEREEIDTVRPQVRQPVRQVNQRRLASLEMDAPRRNGQISGGARLPAAPKSSGVRLNLMGGISSIAGGDATEQAIRDSNNVQQNKYLGANVDVTIQNYFGLEVEGFYGLASTGVETDGVSSADTSLQQMGGAGLLKFQAPIRTGRFRITPKVVGGYGMMILKHSGLYGPAAGSSGLNMKGIMAGGGVELEAFNTIILSVDYVRSFGAGGTYESSTFVQPESLTNANFDRLRVGAYYRLTQNFVLGAQFQQRRVSSDFAGAGFGSPGSQERISQITGSLGIEF